MDEIHFAMAVFFPVNSNKRCGFLWFPSGAGLRPSAGRTASGYSITFGLSPGTCPIAVFTFLWNWRLPGKKMTVINDRAINCSIHVETYVAQSERFTNSGYQVWAQRSSLNEYARRRNVIRQSLLWMDKIHFAAPKKPWNASIPPVK